MIRSNIFVEFLVLYALLKLSAIAGEQSNILLLFIAMVSSYVWFVVIRTYRQYHNRDGD